MHHHGSYEQIGKRSGHVGGVGVGDAARWSGRGDVCPDGPGVLRDGAATEPGLRARSGCHVRWLIVGCSAPVRDHCRTIPALAPYQVYCAGRAIPGNVPAALFELRCLRAADQFGCLPAHALDQSSTVGLAEVVAGSGRDDILEQRHDVLPQGSVAVWISGIILRAVRSVRSRVRLVIRGDGYR
jgi:hypothetical protein